MLKLLIMFLLFFISIGILVRGVIKYAPPSLRATKEWLRRGRGLDDYSQNVVPVVAKLAPSILVTALLWIILVLVAQCGREP